LSGHQVRTRAARRRRPACDAGAPAGEDGPLATAGRSAPRARDPLRACAARLRPEPAHAQPTQPGTVGGPEPARRTGAGAGRARLGAARRPQSRPSRRRAGGADRRRGTPAASGQGRQRLAPRARRDGRRAAEGGGGAVSAAAQRIDASPPAADVAAARAAAPSGPLYQRLIDLFPDRTRPRAGDHRLTRRNVLMLPTRAGLLFAAVVVTMLVTTINYQLSLGYALTFLVAAIAIVGMLHTFRNLATLTLRAGRAEPVFAGQLAEFTLLARNETRLERFALSLNTPGMAQPEYFDVAPGAEHFVAIALPTRQRGWMQVPRLTLATTFPLGLWRAWSRWHPALRVLVYPQPETPAVPLPARSAASGEGTSRGQGHDDIAALRPYVAGDPPRL